jgi:acetyl-CoA carboxylase carboxyl transferase subunit beta
MFANYRSWKKRPPAALKSSKKLEIPKGLWVQCPSCQQILLKKKLDENLRVCFDCGYHFRLTSEERINLLVNEGSFEEFDGDLVSSDPLQFHDGEQSYLQKIEKSTQKTGQKEALRYGLAQLSDFPIVLSVLDFFWMGGSMNTVVGEKFCRAARLAIKTKRPLISVTASGGARMHEGLFSLVQMSRTARAVSELDRTKCPYISVLTDPTTGGVAASFATLGDVHVAEPKALIGFAGKRVIEQTIREKLPSEFQTAEFCQHHGLIDLIVARHNLKETLANLLSYLTT